MFQPTVVCLNIPRVFYIRCLFSNEFIILRGFIVRYVTFYSHVKVVFIPQCRNGLHHRRSMMHI